MNHLQSDREEADAKVLLYALDTDVLVLPLRRYLELCVKTSFVVGTGDSHRVIDLVGGIG